MVFCYEVILLYTAQSYLAIVHSTFYTLQVLYSSSYILKWANWMSLFYSWDTEAKFYTHTHTRVHIYTYMPQQVSATRVFVKSSSLTADLPSHLNSKFSFSGILCYSNTFIVPGFSETHIFNSSLGNFPASWLVHEKYKPNVVDWKKWPQILFLLVPMP